MAERTGKCINFGLCSKADSREIIPIAAGGDFSCPECSKRLTEAAGAAAPGRGSGNSGGGRKALAIGALGLALIAGTAYKYLSGPSKDADTSSTKGSNIGVQDTTPPPGPPSDGPVVTPPVAEDLNATPGAKDEVTSRTKPNEITLVSLTNLFPARFVADVGFLGERYNSRITASGGHQARMELHGEGDGTQFPSLFIEDADPKKFLAYLMIGQAANLIQKLDDPDTGLTSAYLVTKNAKGRENDPELLGKDFSSVLEEASLPVYDSLTTSVNQALQNEYLHKSKREELLAGIEKQLAEVKVARKNPLDKIYMAHVQAVDFAETVLMPKQ